MAVRVSVQRRRLFSLSCAANAEEKWFYFEIKEGFLPELEETYSIWQGWGNTRRAGLSSKFSIRILHAYG